MSRLILYREEGQEIIIGNDILIQVARIDAGAVKLMFEAPKNIRIYRRELYERIVGAKHGNRNR